MKIGSIEITETDVFLPVGISLDESQGAMVLVSLLRFNGNKAAAARDLQISEAQLGKILRRYLGEDAKSSRQGGSGDPP